MAGPANPAVMLGSTETLVPMMALLFAITAVPISASAPSAKPSSPGDSPGSPPGRQ